MIDYLAYVVAASLHRDFDRAFLPLPEKQIILAAADARARMSSVRGPQLDIGPPEEPGPSDPSAGAGARLPITYTLGSLGGTPRYAIASGGATSGACTNSGSPCTLSAANTASVNGDPIVLKSGTYTGIGNTWNGSSWSSEFFITKNSIKLVAESGGTVTFDGSTNIFGSTWTTEGSYKYTSYTPRPCGNGFGITFCTEGQYDNVNGSSTAAPYMVGKWIDQVWIDGVKLQEVVRKQDLKNADVNGPATFWIDRTQNVSGTASVNNNNRNITGVGTNFTVLLQVGDSITLGGQVRTIDQITSNTSARVSSNFSPAVSAQVMQRNGSNRVYLMGATKDAAASEIAICDRGDFIGWHGSDGLISGVTIKRYCNPINRAAAFDVAVTGDRLTLRDIVVEDTTIPFFLQGSATDALEDLLFDHVTVTGANWMGINLTYNDGITWDAMRLTGMDPFNEFDSSPAAGAIKTSRVANSTVKNSFIGNNRSQGVWYDESNWNTHVFNNTFINTGVSGEDSTFFYEISDGLYFYNNVVKSPIGIGVKIAASTNVNILNNNLTGGKDVIGIYADIRSRLQCASTPEQTINGTLDCYDLSNISCGPYALACRSNQWKATWASRPADLNWLTHYDVVQNNLISYPTSVGSCGAQTPFCIVRISQFGTAQLSLANIIPNGVKQDCNVYATNQTSLISVQNPSTSAFQQYTTLSAFSTAMAQAAPWPNETGMEANGLSGIQYINPDGTPTATLTALNDTPASIPSACAFPTDATMNATIPAGTKHYGVLWQ